MKNLKVALALLLSALCFLAVPYPPPTSACGGSGGSGCVVSNTACLKTMVLAKAIPFVIVVPAATPVTFNAPANLFIACPIKDNCGTPCASAAKPKSASLTISLYPFPCLAPLPPPTASGMISTAAATMTLPDCSATGVFNSYTVPVTIPAGTPLGIYCVKGAATVTFTDNTQLTQTGDTVVCLVEEAPGQPGVPRLEVKLLTDNFPRCAPGDQVVAMYQVTNHEPAVGGKSVTFTAFANTEQIALRPTGGNEKQGTFSLAHPFGDKFPFAFDPVGCIPLPDHPFTGGEASKGPIILDPGQTTILNVGIRSYGMCASGSCSESTLRVHGSFTGEAERDLACAGMAAYVDTSMPTKNCGVGVNDCNRNGIPDALDIANGTSQDQNFNAIPDECEQGAPLIPNPVQVTPPVVTLPTEMLALSLVATSPISVPITNVWATGDPFFGNTVLLTNQGGTWTGQIPSDPALGPHTIYALAKDANSQLATHIGLYCRGVAFTDVSPSHPFYTFIEKISACPQITAGCATNPPRYCPNDPVLRSQMAVFLLKSALGPAYVPPPATGIFTDVPDDFFRPWIEDLFKRGVTGGCATNPPRYCPNSPVLRSQMAVFLLRGVFGPAYMPPPATGIFADVPDDFFRPWIEDLFRRGITSGCATNPPRYCPSDPVLRSQMAVFLVRVFKL